MGTRGCGGQEQEGRVRVLRKDGCGIVVGKRGPCGEGEAPVGKVGATDAHCPAKVIIVRKDRRYSLAKLISVKSRTPPIRGSASTGEGKKGSSSKALNPASNELKKQTWKYWSTTLKSGLIVGMRSSGGVPARNGVGSSGSVKNVIEQFDPITREFVALQWDGKNHGPWLTPESGGFLQERSSGELILVKKALQIGVGGGDYAIGGEEAKSPARGGASSPAKAGEPRQTASGTGPADHAKDSAKASKMKLTLFRWSTVDRRDPIGTEEEIEHILASQKQDELSKFLKTGDDSKSGAKRGGRASRGGGDVTFEDGAEDEEEEEEELDDEGDVGQKRCEQKNFGRLKSKDEISESSSEESESSASVVGSKTAAKTPDRSGSIEPLSALLEKSGAGPKKKTKKEKAAEAAARIPFSGPKNFDQTTGLWTNRIVTTSYAKGEGKKQELILVDTEVQAAAAATALEGKQAADKTASEKLLKKQSMLSKSSSGGKSRRELGTTRGGGGGRSTTGSGGAYVDGCGRLQTGPEWLLQVEGYAQAGVVIAGMESWIGYVAGGRWEWTMVVRSYPPPTWRWVVWLCWDDHRPLDTAVVLGRPSSTGHRESSTNDLSPPRVCGGDRSFVEDSCVEVGRAGVLTSRSRRIWLDGGSRAHSWRKMLGFACVGNHTQNKGRRSCEICWFAGRVVSCVGY